MRGVSSPAWIRESVHQGRRLRGRVQLRGTVDSGSTASAVLSAVQQAARRRPDPAEKAWLDRIEQRRAVLGASDEPLQITDFGAGSSRDHGETGAGRTVTRTLGSMTRSSKQPEWAYLLFRLVRRLRPQTCLELGSCVGISAAYQAAALELNGGDGRLLTLEGSDVLAEQSARTLQELGLGSRAQVRVGPFAETLDRAAAELRPLQWAFVDGHHDEAATLAYTEQLLPVLAAEAVLVFDDIDWSPGMRSAWGALRRDPRFGLTVDLRTLGLAVVTAEPNPPRAVRLSYS